MSASRTATLLAAARDGDVDAFEALVGPCAGAAWWLAVALVGPGPAPELVAEAWLEAWRSLPRLRDPARFESRLLGIVVARARRRVHRPRFVREIPAGAPASGDEAFAALPFDARAVLALEAAGLDADGVAAALGVRPRAAVARRRAAGDALAGRLHPGTAGAAGRARSAPDAALLGTITAEVLASAPMPPDLAQASVAPVRAHPGRHAPVRLAALAAAAGFLAVVAFVLASGWRPPIDLLPGPATPAPVRSPDGPFERAAPDEFALIARPGAELRTEADAGASIRHVTGRDVGTRVLVIGRLRIGGRTWVKVEWPEDLDDAAFVWLPSSVRGDASGGFDLPTLDPAEPLCPEVTRSTTELVALMPLPDRLACLGTTPVTLRQVWVEEVEPGPGTGSPAWLAGPATHVVKSSLGSAGAYRLAAFRADPSLGTVPPPATWVQLLGHLDDPAARGCTRTGLDVERAAGDAADQELWCRQQFVVTGWSPFRD
jgi:DNA-directed RNA polymerase specialized sigma24 family protein